eukprot:GHRR01036747.1.p1 GENE.GHRR01036747.1~~GHRR01036747.1.p1  ORF type:complete len:284 (+),score=152.69 GHRR01036747.1:384-1235(+)
MQDAIRRATGSQFTDLPGNAAADDNGADSDATSTSGSDAEAILNSTQQQAERKSSQAEQWQGINSSSNKTSSATDGRQQSGSSTASPTDSNDSKAEQACAAAVISTSAASAATNAAADCSGDDGSDANAEALADAADEAEQAEIAALLAEENITELPYEEGDAAAAALKELDSLTGCPRPDDVLMYAVPVCGPYAALANYKYKVKLTPGTLKKGKAVKQAIELLVRGQDVLPRERDLLRAVPDMDMINAMVGTVKISASGLQQLKAASKKAKKAAAQSRNTAQ